MLWPLVRKPDGDYSESEDRESRKNPPATRRRFDSAIETAPELDLSAAASTLRFSTHSQAGSAGAPGRSIRRPVEI